MTVGPSLETLRLRLDPWSADHERLLIALSSMPAVVRYVGTGTAWPRARAQEVAAAQLQHWKEHGFGWRVAVEKATDQTVGLVALNYVGDGARDVDPDEYEIGWWLDPAAWGNGFAREGAQAIRDHAVSALGAPSVIARIQPENERSIRVASAVGLVRDLETVGRAGERIVIYRASA